MLTLETLVDSLPSMPATDPGEVFMATAGWKRWQRAIDLVPELRYQSSTRYAEQISTMS